MKLSVWARENKIAYGTALKWFHSGNLPVRAEKLGTGTILVYPDSDVKKDSLKTFIYARVSSALKKSDLESQAQLCAAYCIAKGWAIEKTFKEIASGMNDHRPKLDGVLEKDGIRLVVLHKDRLSRFGVRYIEQCIKSRGGEVIVINAEKTDEDDLLKDFIAIITSFCCRLYGARRGQAKALKMKESLVADSAESPDSI